MISRRCVQRVVAGAFVLGTMLVSRTPPAFAAPGECPAGSLAPALATSPVLDECAAGEEAEARLEEELEIREDEEEDQAIAVERTAREAADASEEAAEESREAAEREATASHLPSGSGIALALEVSVSAHLRGARGHRGVTTLSATTNIPAQVGVALHAHGQSEKLFRGRTAGRSYTLRVPWNCHAGAKRFTFAVRAYAEIEGKVGTRRGAAIVHHGSFTVDPRGACEQRGR